MNRYAKLLLSLVVVCLVLFSTPSFNVLADLDSDVVLSTGYSPDVISLNNTSRLSIIIGNNNSFPITNAAWTDILPSGLTFAATPKLSSNCGGSVTIATSPDATLSLSHGYIPENGSCVVAVDVVSTVANTYINSMAAGSMTGTRNGLSVSNAVSADATLTVSAYEYALIPQISFDRDYIESGLSSKLVIDLYNPNSFIISNVVMPAIALPTGLAFSPETVDTPAPATTCGGVVTTDTNTLAFSGGSVPAKIAGTNGSCQITVYVTSTTQGNYTFTVPAAGITADGNGHNSNVANLEATSGLLHVATIVMSAQVNKVFSPETIYPGKTSRLTVNIYNPNLYQLDNASWTDNLVGIQPGLRIADTPGVINDSLDGGCGGTVTADPGGTTLSLSGGMVPAKVGSENGKCAISVNVTSTTQGNLTNTIETGALSATANSGTIAVSNTDPASHTLKVNSILSPSITKSFSPNTVWVNGSSQLTINIKNNDTHEITQVGLTDVLPANVVAATPINSTVSTSCGGASLTASSDSDVVIISGGTIAGGATCTVKLDVKSAVPGVYINRIEAGAVNTYENVTNDYYAQDQLNVQATEVSKVFSPTSFEAGGSSTLTITLQNRDQARPYTNVGLVDILPSPFYADAASTTCGGDVTLTKSTPTGLVDTITLTGGTLPAASVGTPIQTCTITVNVTTTAGAVRTNTTRTNRIEIGALTTAEGTKNLVASTAQITVTPITVVVGKSFSPSPFQAGGTSRVTITLSNNTSKDLTNVRLLDSMPSGLLLVDGTTATTCLGGTASIVEADPPNTTTRGLYLSGASLDHGTSCNFSADVTTLTSATAQTFNNSIGAETLESDEDVTNLTGTSGSVRIYTTGQGLTGSKSFASSVVMAGTPVTLTFTITAPPDRTISGLMVTDHLPAGMVVSSSPDTSVSCGVGASVTANPSSNTISLTGGSMAKSGNCTVSVKVVAASPGTYNNSIAPADVTSTELQTLSSAITSSLRVTNLHITKAFYPDTVSPDGNSTLTITLTNTNTARLTNVNLTDVFPVGDVDNGYFQVAASPNIATTCGDVSIITANAGEKQISMAGGTIPAQVGSVPGVCTIRVDVQGKRTLTDPVQVSLTNSIPTINVSGVVEGIGTIIQPDLAAEDDLIITGLTIGTVKSFYPLTVFGGTSSVLSLTMINENAVPLTGIKFTDVMPTGMYIANPANLSTGTCGGTLTGSPGSTSFSFSGGTLAANKRCTVTLNVTMNKNGNLTNTIPARGITSFNGAANPQPASATLTNLPGVSIAKNFNPSTMVLGDKSTLTIVITNTGNVPLTGMTFTDTLPGSDPNWLTITSDAITNTCGGTLTANEGSNTISLSGGSIDPGPNTTCSITVKVTSTRPGVYTNTIDAKSMTTTEKATNSDPATDVLKITSAPDLQIVKTGTLHPETTGDITLMEEGDKITYTLVATNLGDVTLTNVSISDPMVSMGTCTPAQPATLAKGESLSCAAEHILSAAEAAATEYANTATVISKLPDGVSDGPTDTDTETLPLNQAYAIGIKKSVSNIGPFRLGDIIQYSITVTNLGSNSLKNVTIADPKVVLGTCDPVELAPGAKQTCTASHTVTIADVNAGLYNNKATVTSTQSDGTTPGPSADDEITVAVKQNASIDLFKEIVSDGPYIEGSLIRYEISAKNTGDQTLENVTIVDSGATFSPACASVTLAPGEIVTCYASYQVVASDMTNGGYRNTASVTSTLVGGGTGPTDSTTKTVVTAQPKIKLDKVGVLADANSNGRADAGELINYSFTVTNDGSVTLTNVTLSDIVGGITITGGPTIATLAAKGSPGDIDATTFHGSYVLKQSDIDAGSFTNTAIVTGYPQVGSPVSATDVDLQDALSKPAITLVKTGTVNLGLNSRADAEDTITYSFVVTNTGNVDLHNVVLTDTKFTVSGSSIGNLAIGASVTLNHTYTLTQADVNAGHYDNTASVSGLSPSPANVEVTATSDVDKELSADKQITLLKSGTYSDFNGSGREDAGDKISYTFYVTNPGNVTLTNVLVTDPKMSVNESAVTLQPGENYTFTGTYTLKQADLDAGLFTNKATVNGTPPSGPQLTAESEVTKTFTQSPAIDLVKTGTQSLNIVAPNGEANVGDKITYTFKVTNKGNVTLSNVIVSDTNPSVSIAGSPIATLAPGDANAVTLTGSFTLTQAVIDAGAFTNTATATGTPPAGGTVTSTEGDDQTIAPFARMSLVKTGTLHKDIAGSATVTNPNDTITYTFAVKNTGNVTLTDITLSDPNVTISGIKIDSLAPGVTDSTTFTATHILTQANIDDGKYDNTATVTGKTPKLADVTTTDSESKTGLATPSLSLVKTGILHDNNSNDRVDAGETITYTFTVTNTGNVDLSNVRITDPNATISGGPISLAIGASDSTTFTGTYSLTQTNINAATFTNTATVWGTPPTGVDVSKAASDTKSLLAVPLITLDKTGVANLNVVAPNGIANAGDTVTYSFYVTNPGNVTLTNVRIVDVPGVTTSPVSTTLNPGENVTFTATYTLLQANVDAGTTTAMFVNTATAYGKPPLTGDISVSDSDSKSWAESPSITLEKTGTLDMTVVPPIGVANVGDKINYSFKVTNTGNVTLSGVTVSDTNPSVIITGANIGSLPPGVRTITGSYTLTQADVDAGTFTNTASVSGTSPNSTVVNSSDDDTQSFPASPSISLVKTGTLHQDIVGSAVVTNPNDTITYAFTITNTGNVTLHNITLTDPKILVIGGPTIASLASGASSTIFTGTYSLTQADISAGSFTNTATTTGYPPTGGSVSGSDDDLQNGLSTPSLSLEKSAVLNQGSNGRIDAGETITYHFKVTNTGNVPITNIRITDPKITVTGGPIDLGVGSSDSSTFSGTYTVSQAEINAGTISNTATATGTPTIGGDVTATSTVNQTLSADKTITLIKTGMLDMTVVPPNDIANAGDKINYQFTVTNTGNVPLSNILVTDPKITVLGGAITLAPGDSNDTQFSGSYTLTQTDLDAGVFSNTASVSGTPPIGGPVSATSTDTKNSIASPSVTVEKTGVIDLGIDGLLGAGDQVNYTFKVKNTGNVALTNVIVTEDTPDVTITGGPIATLAIDQTDSSTYTATYTLKQEDINAGSFTNNVTVSAKPPSGPDVTNTGLDKRDFDQSKTITLLKEGTLDKTKAGLPTEVNAGDIITYKFTVQNTGNVTLTNVIVTDPLMTVIGTPISSLEPGAIDNITFTGTYTLLQKDIDLGTFNNTATVTGNSPGGEPITNTALSSVFLVDQPIIGTAKKMVSLTKVSAGTHDVTMDILIKNYGNVTLHSVMVTDDLTKTFPLPTTFTVQSITSSDPSLLLNNNPDGTPVYNGSTDINLLKAGNTLDVGQSKTIRVVVRVIPTSFGPFTNTAWASGFGPEPNPDPDPSSENGKWVKDESVYDINLNPDPNKDNNPNNDQGGAPVEFGARIFDPPSGIKTLDAAGAPYLKWTMVWINETNIVGVHAIVHDPIPEFTKFVPDLVDSGYGVPGSAPADSTSFGVSCTPSTGSTLTTTTHCYYEGPTSTYPRGQIIWEGTLGPDLAVTDPAVAKNAIFITFGVRVNGSTVVRNNAFVDSDLNGDGDALDDGERSVAKADFTWDVTPSGMPETGFAPNRVSLLPIQTTIYKEMGDLWLEIPKLGIESPVVGVPMVDGTWDVSWLGNQIGWLNETAYPSALGNSVLTGHVYLPNGKPGPFVNLNTLSWNDKIVIHVGEKQYIYQVRQVKRVKPDDVSSLEHESSSWLTLVTCQGYDEKSDSYLYRQVVKAVLVEIK